MSCNYSREMTWYDWQYMAATLAQNTINQINDHHAHAQKFAAYIYGKTDAQVATDLGVIEAKVADLRNCMAVFTDLYNCLNNVAVTTSDRKALLLPFA